MVAHMSKKIDDLFKRQPQENLYEMVVIFKPFLPDKVRIQADEKVESIITKYKGSVVRKDIWGKRYLAYPIKGHNEGYYIMYHFKALASKQEEINKLLLRHPEVLRFLIIKDDPKKGADDVKVKVKKRVVKE